MTHDEKMRDRARLSVATAAERKALEEYAAELRDAVVLAEAEWDIERKRADENQQGWDVCAELLEATGNDYQEAKEAVRLLYRYVVELENASAPWFASRSFAVRPDGGQEAGEKARDVLGGDVR